MGLLHLRLTRHVELTLELGDAPVLQFRHALQITGAACGLELQARLFERFLDVRGALHRRFLRFPDLLEVGKLTPQLADLVFQRRQALLRGLIGLLLQRLTFDLQLHQAAVEAIHLLGHGVDLHADLRAGLVDQVDRLVRQLAVGDVAVRQGGRGDDRRVGDLDPVMHLVPLFQAAQDRDRVLDGRLVDQHLLETPFQCRVLLDVLAVFVQCGGADAVQLTARQCRLEHIAGVHRTLGLAGADHGMDLVDEQDDLPFLLRKVIEHRLEPLLELTAELGACDQRSHVERQQALVLQALGHLAVDDALGQTLYDCGLSDTGFTDQHRVVLGPPLQHLHRPPDLIVAPDHRVEFALLGSLSQVDGVFLQGLALLLGIRVVHRLPAAYLIDRLAQRTLARTRPAHDLADRTLVLDRGQNEQFGRDVLVLALLRELVGLIEQATELIGDMHVTGRALHRRQAVQRLAKRRAQLVHIDVGLGEQMAYRAPLLIEQCRQQVRGLDELVVTAHRNALGIGQRHLEFACQSVHPHGEISDWSCIAPDMGRHGENTRRAEARMAPP